MKNISTAKRKLVVGFKGLVTTTDETIMDFAYSPKTYNFTFTGGVLRAEMGINNAAGRYLGSLVLLHEYAAFPDGIAIKGVYPYQRRLDSTLDDRMIVQTDENKLYYTKIFEPDTWHEIVGCVFSGTGSAVNYNYDGKDVLLMSSESCPLTIIDGNNFTTVASAPRFSSIAVHYERVYGTVNGDHNEVWFSDDFNPTNWTVTQDTGGYIRFADDCGDLLQVVSFLNYLYVFREHGIFRLTAFAEQTEFSLKKVFTETGRIYKPTIALCGDRIIFLAEEGLFSFDGYTVQRIASDLPKLQTCNTAVGAYHSNYYYLGCNIHAREFNFGVTKNDALVRYDLRDRSICCLAPLDVLRLVPCNIHHSTELIVVLGKGTKNRLGMIRSSGRIFGVNTRKMYFSPKNNMNTDMEKIVREVTILAKRSVTLSVVIDEQRYSYNILASNLPQTIFVGKCGYIIGFELDSSEAGAYITPLVVRIETL